MQPAQTISDVVVSVTNTSDDAAGDAVRGCAARSVVAAIWNDSPLLDWDEYDAATEPAR